MNVQQETPLLRKNQASATALGICALVLWSMSIAFARSLSEQLGHFTTASYNYLVSGFISVGFYAFLPKGLKRFRGLSPKYFFGCGFFFVLYTICLYTAVGLAETRIQVLEIGLINYLWPSFTLLFSVPVLGKKAKWFIVPGMIIGFSGIVFASMQKEILSLNAFLSNIRSNWFPYAAAFIAAVSWGLYSNFARKWGGDSPGSGVPLFFFASGIIILPLRFIFSETSNWTGTVCVEFLICALFTTVIGYIFWDIAMRRGNLVLVAALSYATPLIATVITCVYLQVVPGIYLWIGCLLIICGAGICKFSIIEDKESRAETQRRGD
jgi:drug/metabolite transporter (DMT)-like permease